MVTPVLRERLSLDLSPDDVAGKSVLVVGEQGVGDQVMFASMLPDLAAAAGSAACVCDSRLTRLLARSFPEIAFTAAPPPERFDHILPLGSLGRLFRPAAERFPGLAYLRPSDAVAAAWRRRLGPATATLRVGLSWRGEIEATGAAAGSMALETLRPLLEREDCEFVSLQYGPVRDELAAINATLPRPIRVFPADDLNDFEQLAGLVQAMDVVVSVQNTTVHLSGALGKTCLAMIPVAPEWSYGAAGEAMPWYRSVRLLRQAERGAWEPMVTAVGAELDAFAAAARAVAEALALGRAGKVEAAIAVLETLGTALNDHVRATGLMGTLRAMAGRAAAALPWFNRSLELNPLQPVVLADLGNALGKLDRAGAAIECYDRALRIEPGYTVALNNRAGKRLDLKDGPGALEDADAALAIKPDLASAHRLRSRALILLDRIDEAAASLDQAARLQPDNPDNLSIRAGVLTASGRFSEACASLDEAVALDPGEPNFLQARAYARLRLHDFAGGWADHERRWEAAGFKSSSRGPVPLELISRLQVDNRRDDLAGKRVLVIGEQGVGDQIMFASMLPDLLRDADAVTCVTSPRMRSLFEASFSGLRSLPDMETVDPDAFDRVVPIGSLGPVYRNTAADFPGEPYLRPRDGIVTAWRARLGEKTSRLRVGISWRGGSASTGGLARSLSLEALRPLLERPDCEFVSLQYGDVRDEVEAFNQTLARPIRVFPREEIDNFEDLAGLVTALDLVVSVQTTVIHLSGALGKPCLVMIPFVPEWRYGASGETMPWYSSVRLLRQPERGAWGSVIAAVGAAIDGLAAPEPPLSHAEVDVLVARARAAARAGRMADGVEILETAGPALTTHAGAATLMSGLLLRLGQAERALPYFEALVALEPANAAAFADMGKALVRLGRPEGAVEAFGKAIALTPEDGPLRVQRAAQRLELKQSEAALADLDALVGRQDIARLGGIFHQLRSRALLATQQREAALAAIDAALAIEPGDARHHYVRGRIMLALSRPDDARAALERAIEIDPAGDPPRYMLSMLQLREREFETAWPNYERRWRISWFLRDSAAMVPVAFAPRLNVDNQPEDFDGKSVLVIAEQGVGDQVMFAGAFPDLAARAASVTVVSVPKLTKLLQASFPGFEIIPPLPSLRPSSFDKVVGIGSLPAAFRRRLADFPGAPYLRPRPEAVETWKARLGPKTARLRVGLSWRGGSDRTSGQKRSIDLEQLRPLLERADCEFVSLQYGDVEAEVAAFNATLARPIRIFSKDEIEDFEPLAALVLGLDLVVSVQTAIIHLCGALGAPCLVMIPSVAEWRYGAEGETMPWYGSVKLLRQIKADDWAPVIEAVGAELAARAKV